MTRTCFYCGKEMDSSEAFMIALDTPLYANLFVHKATCLKEIESLGISNYLNKNMDRIKEFSLPIEPRSSKATKRKR